MTEPFRRMAEGGERRGEHTRATPVYEPLTDIFETPDALVLSLECPGADAETLSVSLDKRVLTITAHAKPAIPEGYTLVHAEYRTGDYERAFSVPEGIDVDRIEAAYRDGVLTVTLPKAKPAPAKTIKVSAT